MNSCYGSLERRRTFPLLICSLLLFLLQPCAGTAQSVEPLRYLFEPIGVNEGLGTSEIYTIYQDRHGFIWVGTNNGVSRYDGYRFQNYYQSDSGRIGSINDLLEDQQGRLWIGGQEGLFYQEGGRFIKVPAIDHLISAMSYDQEGRLWLAGTNFVPFFLSSDQLEGIRHSIPAIPTPIADSSEWIDVMGELRVWKMTLDRENRIYFGNDRHLGYFDGEHMVRLMKYTEKDRAWINSINAISPDSVFITGEYLLFSQVTNQQVIPVMERLSNCSFMTEEAIYFLGGPYMYRFQGGRWTILFSLTDFGVDDFWNREILLDAEGNFWIATYDGALLKFSPSYFQNYQHKEYPVLNTNFSATTSEDGTLIIGGHRGRILTKENQTFVPYFSDHPRITHSSPVRDIWMGSDSLIWFASEREGLIQFRNGTFTNYKEEEAENNHFFLFHSSDALLWSGNNGSISKIEAIKTDAPKIKSIPWTSRQGRTIPSTGINVSDFPTFIAMAEDPWQQLWLASNKGLFYVKDEQIVPWSFPTYGSNQPAILDIEIDPKGRIWISTLGGGIWEGLTGPDYHIQLVKQWTQGDGLLSDVFLGLHIDTLNRLWMADITGICCLDSGDIQCFTQEDGWMNVTSQWLKMEERNGRLWMIGYNAISSLLLYDFQTNRKVPQANILSVSLLYGKEDVYQYAQGRDAATGLPDRLVLPYDKNLLQFRFSSSSQSHPSKNQYLFMLDGMDEDWQQKGSLAEATYSHIPPGSYTFRIHASNNDNEWSEKPAEFSFEVLPPWWESKTAYSIYFLIAIGLSFLLRRQLVRRQRLRNQLRIEQLEKEKMREIEQFRARFYTNITHEFRTPLTVIQGMGEQIIGHEQIKLLIQRNSNRLLDMVNQLLDLSKLESKSMAIQWVHGEVIPYLRYLTESCHSLAQNKSIELIFFAEEDQIWMDYDENKLQQILSNLISNAIKFTSEFGTVKVMVSRIEKDSLPFLVFRIKDSGKGIPTDKLPFIFNRFYQVDDSSTRHGEGSGIGLALVKELVDLFQGNIQVTSEFGKGSTFTVHLPILQQVHTELKQDDWHTSVSRNEAKKESLPLANTGKEGSDRPVILVVEDNTDVITYIYSCLQNSYELHSAKNGKEGVSMALQVVPDLILSDVMMPEMDGFEFCRIVKTNKACSHVPVIMLTAKATQEDKLTGLSLGADAYLTKPFHKEELLLRINNLIEGNRRLREHLAQETSLPFTDIREKQESQFLLDLREILDTHMGEETFNTDKLCKEIGMSRTQLHRKLKALTDQSTAGFIRSARLTKAKSLLQQTILPIGEISMQVGYKDFSHFSRSFSKEFGQKPSEIRK
ncbi:MAG: ATP-binding protein [Bacteroidota bacterium]